MAKDFKEKNNTHLVLKRRDIERYLENEDIEKLYELEYKINAVKRCNNKSTAYIVVNRDEPYANEVMEVVRRGELEKEEAN